MSWINAIKRCTSCFAHTTFPMHRKIRHFLCSFLFYLPKLNPFFAVWIYTGSDVPSVIEYATVSIYSRAISLKRQMDRYQLSGDITEKFESSSSTDAGFKLTLFPSTTTAIIRTIDFHSYLRWNAHTQRYSAGRMYALLEFHRFRISDFGTERKMRLNKHQITK